MAYEIPIELATRTILTLWPYRRDNWSKPLSKRILSSENSVKSKITHSVQSFIDMGQYSTKIGQIFTPYVNLHSCFRLILSHTAARKHSKTEPLEVYAVMLPILWHMFKMFSHMVVGYPVPLLNIPKMTYLLVHTQLAIHSHSCSHLPDLQEPLPQREGRVEIWGLTALDLPIRLASDHGAGQRAHTRLMWLLVSAVSIEKWLSEVLMRCKDVLSTPGYQTTYG